jgi:hypothetical protein
LSGGGVRVHTCPYSTGRAKTNPHSDKIFLYLFQIVTKDKEIKRKLMTAASVACATVLSGRKAEELDFL